MKFSPINLIIISTSCLLIGCKTFRNQKAISELKDNPLIEKMYFKDIELRKIDAKTDTVILENYDKIHREKIFELLANYGVKTPIDKYRSALILQHTAAKICDGQITSISSENFLLAFKLSSAALNELKLNNETIYIEKENIPRMVALNYDRYLLFTFGHQKYGTQFVFDELTGEMLLAPIDTTLSNDEERKKYNVETLDQLLKKHKIKPMQR